MRSIVVYPRDPVPEPDPALITLDLPIPSIPLLGPILTQLIAGRPTSTATTPAATGNTPPANQPTTSATPQTTNKSPTTTTKTTAASTPTSGSSSGNSGSNSGDNAGSNGSSGSSSSSGSGTNSGNGSSNSNSNSQSGSGSSSGSSGNGSSSSSPQNGTNNDNNNNTSGTNGNSTSNSGDESGSNGNNSKNENISVVNNNLVAISSNSDGKLTTSTIVAGVGGVDNVGTLPSGIALSTRTLDSGSKTVIVITPTPSSVTVVATGKGHGTSPVMVTITAGSSSGSGSNGGSDNSGSAKGSHIAAGALVGIITGAILILLLLIGGFLALKRRRYQHKREQRRQAWGIGWWKKNEDRNRGIGYTPSRESRAARSSFGSMVDRGLRPVTPLAGGVASSNGHDLESGTNGALFYSGTDDLHAQTRRESIVTDSSEMAGEAGSSSRTLANEPGYLYVADGRGYLEAPQLSPISVRPFSPSETFSFPQPPQSISTNSLRSARTSRTSYTYANDPFADPSAHFIPSSPPPSPPPPPSQLTLSQSQSPTAATAASARVETIQRPFAPTLEDELSVKPGDKVVMLEVFDDGWAKIRRFNKDENKSEEGLIPIDCLREKGEDVPAFLAAKRISSYHPSADRVSIKY